ncbi:hypothetical protein BDN70DRAFT_516074 [Pholiota conissans]|uniref:Uncharacterized protein n=1 Tax=Pholiota conissans TaxID=109636 RepID=A0A9P5YNU0_9AGAR|nr:hypothetical protein BDN70DRAFT_516074 [Pholiota conissans]
MFVPSTPEDASEISKMHDRAVACISVTPFFVPLPANCIFPLLAPTVTRLCATHAIMSKTELLSWTSARNNCNQGDDSSTRVLVLLVPPRMTWHPTQYPFAPI